MRSQVEKNLIAVLRAAYEKKGENILLLDLKEIAPFLCDYFVIVSGHTKEHLQAISDNIVEALERDNIPLDHIEGYEVGRWILLDYGDLVVHVMTEEAREYYALENLWGDAKTLRYPEDFEDEPEE